MPPLGLPLQIGVYTPVGANTAVAASTATGTGTGTGAGAGVGIEAAKN